MENRDLELLSTLAQSNEELSRLLAEHDDFERQLSGLTRRRALTPQQEVEVQRIKKLKLQGRDRIEEILAQHRT